MKVFLKKTVLEASLDRIAFLFDEFEDVLVSFSGGKDSTVCLHLCLEIARQKNRLPLKVVFLDQEAEWQSTVDYVRRVMQRPDVDPLWLQVPFRLSNSTNPKDNFLFAWDEAKPDEWMRAKEPNSIHENTFSEDRFHMMFDGFLKTQFKGRKACYIGGIRTEESPSRYMATTTKAKYKHITYGKRFDKSRDHYTFYPIYDWSYTDVWKFIHDGQHDYCTIYNEMYRYGIKIPNMRVSSLIHETALHSLEYAQEIERDTFNALTKRMEGINTVSQMGDHFFCPKELPQAFESWSQYVWYLAENLSMAEGFKKRFMRQLCRCEDVYGKAESVEMYRTFVSTLLSNDESFTKLQNWECRPEVDNYRKYLKGIISPNTFKNKLVNAHNA